MRQNVHATVPSFVTCPTIKMVILSPFDNCNNLAVVSLTCDTEPGAAPTCSLYIV